MTPSTAEIINKKHRDSNRYRRRQDNHHRPENCSRYVIPAKTVIEIEARISIHCNKAMAFGAGLHGDYSLAKSLRRRPSQKKHVAEFRTPQQDYEEPNHYEMLTQQGSTRSSFIILIIFHRDVSTRFIGVFRQTGAEHAKLLHRNPKS